MLSFISDFEFEDEIEYAGKVFFVNLSYNRVLKAYHLFLDEKLSSKEQIELSFAEFIDKEINFSKIDDLSLWAKADIVNGIFEYINTGNLKTSDNSVDSADKFRIKNKVNCSSSKKAIDFFYDASAIYAAFLQDYDIDLIKEKDSLHWFNFMALLENISEKTKLYQIVSYRNMKIPIANKYNIDEVRRLRELKNFYALPSEISSDDGNNIDNSMATIFSILSNVKK